MTGATETELQHGYELARAYAGDEYANCLIAHDAELAAKGYDLKPWPESLLGNEGD